jgi:murein DD-endopeptidase MepM/ murein hydrolase activator NlpD
VLLACVALFFVPTPLVPQVSHFRDLAPEIQKYSGTPSFVFTLPDSAYFFQASRYALGRYTATVATREEVYAYQAETLAKNPKLAGSPKAGDEIRYYRPEHLSEAEPVDATAWRFWTGIFSDSVAYLTEGYHERESKNQRKHLGIDIATPRGSRILAPFSGEAWVQKGERSGQSIALVGKESVLVFMHCDQVFYLDGQAVVAGDPIATVGMTGHTTGPHVHVQAGVLNPKGESKIGAIRYDIMSPFAWYFQFSRFSKGFF